MKKNSFLALIVVVIALVAWWVYKQNNSSTLANKPLSDFAIEDTASVTKIIITDHLGRIAKVERIPGNKLWRLNDKYFAREDAIETLLKTINRIRVRGNVSQGARDNMMKLLATSGKRAEIFTGGNQPAKIYYVGVPTPDHTGTIMLLEIPGIGRSEEPYVTHMDGFTGFLSTRFFADEAEWRYTGIYDYPNLEFKSVKIIQHEDPQESFEVRYGGGNNIQLWAHFNPTTQSFDQPVEHFDTLSVKDLLLGFRKLHVESYNTYLKPETRDSLTKAMPVYSIILTDNQGQVKRTDLFRRKAAKDEVDEKGQPIVWDGARYWARTPDGEFAVAQVFNFGVQVLPLQAYIKK